MKAFRSVFWLLIFTSHYSLVTSHCLAEVPRTIHYQGRLSADTGVPLTGDVRVTLRLYTAAGGGQALWTEDHEVSLAKLDNGFFSVDLGSKTPFNDTVDFNTPLWLTTEVNGEGELSPRQLLSAVSYAINADLLDGLDSTAFLAAAAAAVPPEVSRLGEAIESPEVADGTLTAADTADDFLTAGAGAAVTKTGASWQISAPGVPAGPAAARASAGASNAVTIGTGADTELASVSLTTASAASAVLVLATVQLNHAANPNDKTVDVKLFRNGVQLDGSWRGRIGTANRAISELPVTLHAYDTPGAGPMTFSVKARSSAAGAQATVRRLTVIELP